ncbi:MAG: hypothetical protein O3C45_04200 [Bacteroidetes bacterium]|nr:hypothetical protein [Bacteroidota bacterium]MDA0874246.1 hypothetical protein [Bacteroidota bacterium]
MKEKQKPSTEPVKLALPKDDFSRSVIGFVVAAIIGALVPRTIGYLARRVFVRSFREVFILVAAGFLTERLVRLIVGSGPSTSSPTKRDD